MDVLCLVTASALTPGNTYWCQGKWVNVDGITSNNFGLGSQVADANGKIVFQGNPTIFASIAAVLGPGQLSVWISETEGGDPISPVTFETDIPVV